MSSTHYCTSLLISQDGQAQNCTNWQNYGWTDNLRDVAKIVNLTKVWLFGYPSKIKFSTYHNLVWTQYINQAIAETIEKVCNMNMD